MNTPTCRMTTMKHVLKAYCYRMILHYAMPLSMYKTNWCVVKNLIIHIMIRTNNKVTL